MCETIDFCDENFVAMVNDKIHSKWIELMHQGGIFRYLLNVEREKVLDGKVGFLVQVQFNSHCLIQFSIKLIAL